MFDVLVPYGTGALAFLAFSTLAAGLARGFSGFGSALIFVPLASTVLGPTIAIPLLLVVDGVLTLGMIPAALRVGDRREVLTMTLGAAVGIPLGGYLLTRLDPVVIRWSIVVLVASLLSLLISGWRFRGKPVPLLTVLVGFVAGFFSGVAQVGGPPVVVYWLGGVMSAIMVRANFILYFAITTLFSTVAYIAIGLITREVLILAVIVAPLYALGLWAGGRMFGIASEITFRKVCYAMIAGAAIISMPLWDGILR